jgi:hypothetical protein
MLRTDQVAALNLAHRPLANRKPLQRAVAALWTAAALVLAVDVALAVRHVSTSTSGRGRLLELERDIAAEVEEARRLEASLRGFDLDEQNRHVEFLNAKIAQRTFPWSRLFQQLGDVLPDGVRLQSLRPIVEDDEEDRGARAPAAARAARPGSASDGPRRWVLLQIAGQAETDDSILELVDALFGHPAFSSPNLRNESQERGMYRFQLSVLYLPDLDLDARSTVGPTVSAAASASDERDLNSFGAGP